MKKLIVFLAIMFLSSTAFAAVDSWMPANQFTVAWDSVTTHDDGSALPTGSVIEYEVVMAGVDKANPQVLWSGVETAVALTVPSFGRYILGVKSILKVDGVVVAESVYGWSDDPAIANSGTFGVLYFKAPAKITGLVRQ